MDYTSSHPWLSFPGGLEPLNPTTWMLLGEAVSKAQHIAGVPLKPELAKDLNGIYLNKGVHATTQIEGNTLSEEEVRLRVSKELELPPSEEYLGTEIDNVIAAYNVIIDDVYEGHSLKLSPERICQFNKLVLNGLSLDPDINPGKLREFSVTVGNYRGAPAQDLEYLLNKLCKWLEKFGEVDSPMKPYMAVLAAIYAHLYIAWIHPFGDGNGRVARLVEFQLLIEAGFPTLAAHVLADYYNRTRSEYYRQLQETSREPYSTTSFVTYALQGLVDGLRKQITYIQQQQLSVAWVNYVNEQFHDNHGKTAVRQRRIMLDLPLGKWIPLSALKTLSPELALLYAQLGGRAAARDVNKLESMRLVNKVKKGTVLGIEANIRILQGFLPLVAKPK